MCSVRVVHVYTHEQMFLCDLILHYAKLSLQDISNDTILEVQGPNLVHVCIQSPCTASFLPAVLLWVIRKEHSSNDCLVHMFKELNVERLKRE